MPLSDHVSLTITQDSVGIARAGFGVPLILSVNAAWAERVRSYTSEAAVAADFVTTSPEYLAAAAMFAQTPHPEKILIGRAVGKPTQRYTLSVAAVRNSYTYSIKVRGQGVTTTTVSYTSDGTATDAEIVGNLVSGLNAVTGKNFTASGASSPFTVTGDAPGNWFSLEVSNIADLSIQQDHAEPATTLATDLNAIKAENNTWYALYTLYNSVAYVTAAMTWVESNKKIYTPDVNDSNAATLVEASGVDVLDDIDEQNLTRTAGLYYREPANMYGARLLGRFLPADPGSITAAYKTLAGAVADTTLTDTHKTNLSDRQASYYKSEAGVDFNWDGKVGDSSILFLDVRRDLDWLEDDMAKGVFGALVANDKLPFTDEGVAVIEAEVRASLRRAEALGIIASGWTVTVPKVSSISASNKALRLLPDVKFAATLAGAIHKVNITGVVSV